MNISLTIKELDLACCSAKYNTPSNMSDMTHVSDKRDCY